MVKINHKKKVCYNRAEVLLRDRFRLLWEQHVYWTRMVILGIGYDSKTYAHDESLLVSNSDERYVVSPLSTYRS